MISSETTNQEGYYLFSIEPIPSSSSTDSKDLFPAYFVGSTAPNNVEDKVKPIPNPRSSIQAIAEHLRTRTDPELLIVVHGYNTALGSFDSDAAKRNGVKGWYQDIRDHVAREYPEKNTDNLVMLGYRWSSEQIKGLGNDSFAAKFSNARKSLPIGLQVIVYVAVSLFLSISILAATTQLPKTTGFAIAGITFLILSTIAISTVFTLFILRIVGYFRDAYRSNSFGVPDLVELLRQLDQSIWSLDRAEHEQGTLAARLKFDPNKGREEKRIKLSFIAHSMGASVVTNAVRILSDVFDERSIGSLNLESNNTRSLPSDIGHAFCLERLVLVSPDIPAEALILGRANFLSASLRRFEEAYLFSNEGDMALKLASTAANYSSFPSRTREGGYRLGNVVVRSRSEQNSDPNKSSQYGIVNLDSQGNLLDAEEVEAGKGIYKLKKVEREVKVTDDDGTEATYTIKVSSFLDYLYVLNAISLLERQTNLISFDQTSIAERFTVFDCTDYQEVDPKSQETSPKTIGLLTRSLGKPAFNFWDYIWLSFDYFTGKIDTHGGYFYSRIATKSGEIALSKPDATFSKELIYGLACLGFRDLVARVGTQEKPSMMALQTFSKKCAERSVQVLLAVDRRNSISEPPSSDH